MLLFHFFKKRILIAYEPPAPPPNKKPGHAPARRAQIKPTPTCEAKINVTARLVPVSSWFPSICGEREHDGPLGAPSVRSPEAAVRPPVPAGRSRRGAQQQLLVDQLWGSRGYVTDQRINGWLVSWLVGVAVRSAPQVSDQLLYVFSAFGGAFPPVPAASCKPILQLSAAKS